MSGLTHKQAKVLLFIRTFILAHGNSPSLREIADGTGMKSGSSAHRYVLRLCERGAITCLHGRRRSIAIARGLHEITVDLPAELDHQVRTLAEQAGVTPEAVAIEAIRDGLRALCSRKVSRAAIEFSSPPQTDLAGSPVRSSLG